MNLDKGNKNVQFSVRKKHYKLDQILIILKDFLELPMKTSNDIILGKGRILKAYMFIV